MKFVLVFLIGCFAIAAQASSVGYFENDLNLPSDYQIDVYAKQGLVEKLRELIDVITKKAKEIINSIISKTNEIAARIVKKIEEILEQSNVVIKGILEKVCNKIDEIAQQNEIARKCVDENRPAIQAAVEEANEKLHVCANNAREQSENIIKDMQVPVNAIRDNIESLRALVNGCIENNSNPVEVAKCIGAEAQNIRDTVLQIFGNAKKGLAEAAESALAISREVKDCSKTTVTELEQKLVVAAETIEKCVNDNSNTENLLIQ